MQSGKRHLLHSFGVAQAAKGWITCFVHKTWSKSCSLTIQVTYSQNWHNLRPQRNSLMCMHFRSTFMFRKLSIWNKNR